MLKKEALLRGTAHQALLDRNLPYPNPTTCTVHCFGGVAAGLRHTASVRTLGCGTKIDTASTPTYRDLELIGATTTRTDIFWVAAFLLSSASTLAMASLASFAAVSSALAAATSSLNELQLTATSPPRSENQLLFPQRPSRAAVDNIMASVSRRQSYDTIGDSDTCTRRFEAHNSPAYIA